MTHSRAIRHYGWIPDVPDQRDHLYAAPAQYLKALPALTDLRAKCPPVYDQGELGSCTGNAIAAAFDFVRLLAGEEPITPSRLFIYYNERQMEGTINSDAGAMIRDGIKSVNHEGVCPEALWPYDIKRFTAKPKEGC